MFMVPVLHPFPAPYWTRCLGVSTQLRRHHLPGIIKRIFHGDAFDAWNCYQAVAHSETPVNYLDLSSSLNHCRGWMLRGGTRGGSPAHTMKATEAEE